MPPILGLIARFSGILAPKQYFVGTEVDETVYHVLLQGRTVGPYDRRTIVGMRIKKALTSGHVLIGTDGAQLTVADLLRRRPAQPSNAERRGSVSVVQATFSASLLEVDGPGMHIPRFKDEVQARVQGDVLRVAGRFRRGLGWKQDRVKIVLRDVIHSRVKGSQVELWLRNAAQTRLQRIALELFTTESAAELAEWLPGATPFPEPLPAAPEADGSAGGARLFASPASSGLWVAVVGLALVVGLMVTVLLLRRVY